MLNSIVDKVFVITTVGSNRVDYIKNHLLNNHIVFDFVVAPDPIILTKTVNVIDTDSGDTRPALSLISANVSIIETAKISNFKKICILEDDIFFSETWEKQFNNFYKNVPANWDVLNLGYHPSQYEKLDRIRKINDFVNIPLYEFYTTHCMLLTCNVYDSFLDINRQHQHSYPTDYIYNEIYRKFNCFSPSEKIAYQLSVRKNCEYNIPISTRFNSLLSLNL